MEPSNVLRILTKYVTRKHADDVPIGILIEQKKLKEDLKNFNKIGDNNECFTQEKFGKLDSDTQDFLKKLLCDHNKRMSAKEALSHPFITQSAEKMVEELN